MENVGTIAALGGLAGGCALGFAARWGRFCTLNAIEIAVLGRDTSGLRMWAIAIATAIIGTYALDLLGFIDLSTSFYIANPTTILATIIGSLLFGIGMALVGTCGYGCLARMGGGDLKSFVTFLVMGVSAYATLRGATAYIRVYIFGNNGPAPETSQSFAHYFAAQTSMSIHSIAFILALLIAMIALASKTFRGNKKKIGVGMLVGAAIVWGWFTTGYLANDPFEPYPLESYTFSAPLGESLIYIMAMSGTSLKFGIGAVFGVVLGAAITSIALGHFRWEACDDAREMRRQILGGFLMGIGSVTALGCTIGQGISAASMLAFSAPIALASVFIGAWLGLNYLIHGSIRLALHAVATSFKTTQ